VTEPTSRVSNLTEPLRQWESERRRRGPDCLSDRALDGVLTGETRDVALATARAHLAACTSCTTALQALTADRERFLAESNLAALAADALARAARAPERSWWRRLIPALTVTAAAAAAIVILPRLQQDRPQDGDLRAKGTTAPAAKAPADDLPSGLGLAMFVKHSEQRDGSQIEPHWGELLHPGDQIRLTLDNDQAGKVTVLAVDASGQISVYQPAVSLKAGRAVPLPQAIELDSTLGDEVIVALRCPDNVATQAVVAAAGRALDRTRVKQDPAGALGNLALPCVEVRYAIQKVALP
jgi:hypothetical protein